MRRADPEADEVEIKVRLIVARVGKRSDADIQRAVSDTLMTELTGKPVEYMAYELGDPPGPPGVIVDVGETEIA